MQGRTFFRVMLEMFLDNALFRAIHEFVKFCNEMGPYSQKTLKFSKNMPINNITKEEYYKNKFVFNSITGNRTGLR